MIKFVNSTICIYFKQQPKGIIIFIVVFIFGLTQNSPTKINHLQGIFNRSNCGTEAHYIITIKHLNSMYVVFDSRMKFLHSYRSLFGYKKIWIGDMKLTCFFTSISVLNYSLEKPITIQNV